MFGFVMTIYIIHEFDIVKILYRKNIVSHRSVLLNDFAHEGLALPLLDNGRQLGGKGNASLASVPPWERARTLWTGGRLQAW